MTHGAIDVVERPPQATAVVCGHAAGSALPRFLGEAFGEVMRRLSEQQLTPAGPPFARYTPTGDGFDVEAGFPASGPVAAAGRVVPGSLPGGAVATTVYRGDYAGLAGAYDDVDAWLPAHGYTCTGAPWESYLDEPGVAEPRTLISFPCAPA